MPQSLRLKAVCFNEFAIQAILTGRALVVPFPEGTEVVRYAEKWETHSAVVIITHPSFDEIAEGHMIPLESVKLEPRLP